MKYELIFFFNFYIGIEIKSKQDGKLSKSDNVIEPINRTRFIRSTYNGRHTATGQLFCRPSCTETQLCAPETRK